MIHAFDPDQSRPDQSKRSATTWPGWWKERESGPALSQTCVHSPGACPHHAPKPPNASNSCAHAYPPSASACFRRVDATGHRVLPLLAPSARNENDRHPRMQQHFHRLAPMQRLRPESLSSFHFSCEFEVLLGVGEVRPGLVSKPARISCNSMCRLLQIRKTGRLLIQINATLPSPNDDVQTIHEGEHHETQRRHRRHDRPHHPCAGPVFNGLVPGRQRALVRYTPVHSLADRFASFLSAIHNVRDQHLPESVAKSGCTLPSSSLRCIRDQADQQDPRCRIQALPVTRSGIICCYLLD